MEEATAKEIRRALDDAIKAKRQMGYSRDSKLTPDQLTQKRYAMSQIEHIIRLLTVGVYMTTEKGRVFILAEVGRVLEGAW